MSRSAHRWFHGSLVLLMVGLLASTVLSLRQVAPVAGQTSAGTIAYIRANDATGDEIRLIEPDGRNDRRIWSVGRADPGNLVALSDLDWRPDARELAFSSNHEEVDDGACSIFDANIYAISPDGTGYRRVTNAPACAGLSSYPQGVVTVSVRNFSTRSLLFVYMEGAPRTQSVLVSQGSAATVTFTNVADFGDGLLQQAVVIGGDGRWLAPLALADVKPGETVHSGVIHVAGAATKNFGAYVPSWHSDGAQLGYILTSAGSMFGVSSSPRAGDYGQPLLNLGAGNVPSADVMDWGPTPALANQILYYSHLNSGIYHATAGANNRGTKLVETGIDQIIDLQWLPDGSGFLFTRGDWLNYANLYRYDFATRSATPLTQFTAEFVIDISVSPDGAWIAVERAATNTLITGDLWIMRRDGSDMRLLVENAMRPAWSQSALPAPLTPRIYVPLIRR